MGKYKTRPDGLKCGSITIDGKRRYVYGKTNKEVDQKKEQLLIDSQLGRITASRKATMGEFATYWKELKTASLAAATQEMYENLVKIITNELGNFFVADITVGNITKMLNLYNERLRTKQQLVMTLKQIFDFAQDERQIVQNPMKNIPPVKYKAKQKRALTEAETAALWAADLTGKDRAFLGVLYYCGLRRGEALALTRQDIDWKNKVVRINKDLVMRNDGTTQIKESPKTAAGFRSVPMPEDLVKLLQAYQPSGLYLFERARGGLHTKSSFKAYWDRILLALNEQMGGVNIYDQRKGKRTAAINMVEGLTPHIFRHNYATMLYYAGVDLKDAQRLLGHSSVSITLQIYTHLDAEKSTALERLDSYLRKA